MGYAWDFSVVWEYKIVFVWGAFVTAKLTALAFVIALVIGFALALLRISVRRWLRAPATFYVEVLRSTPALVQLVWIYYALPIVTGLQLDSFTSVGVGLGLHTSAYYCEVIRAGILAVDRGQIDAAKAVGMRHGQVMRRIVLPQAVRFMVPPFMNETANLIKLTTLGSVLAVPELLHAGNNLITNTYRPLEVYTAIAIVFAVIIYPVIWASRQLEKYWSMRS
jgi:polar amino acid transport system permease protein